MELLESCWRNICSWPNPTPGKTLDLPVLGKVLSFHVPHISIPHLSDKSRSQAPLPKDSVSFILSFSIWSELQPFCWLSYQIISNLHAVEIFSYFQNSISILWIIWELMLINEPILIVSPSLPPFICSDVTMVLLSLISPVWKPWTLLHRRPPFFFWLYHSPHINSWLIAATFALSLPSMIRTLKSTPIRIEFLLQLSSDLRILSFARP